MQLRFRIYNRRWYRCMVRIEAGRHLTNINFVLCRIKIIGTVIYSAQTSSIENLFYSLSLVLIKIVENVLSTSISTN